MKDKLLNWLKQHQVLFNLVKNAKNLFVRLIRSKHIYFLTNSVKPISNNYGSDRGSSIDRYYINKFLSKNQKLINGHCLEIADNVYTKQFGQDKVTQSEILDIDIENKKATIYGDLKKLPIPDNIYDCIILTQVFQFIDNLESAINECYRILKPGGNLLVTLPSISRIDIAGGINNDYWRFTAASAKYLFSKKFADQNLEIKSQGNALAGLGFWIGLAKEEINQNKLDYRDENFPCLITVKATK